MSNKPGNIKIEPFPWGTTRFDTLEAIQERAREEAEERIATNEANGVAVKVQGYIPKRNPRIEAHNEGLGGL